MTLPLPTKHDLSNKKHHQSLPSNPEKPIVSKHNLIGTICLQLRRTALIKKNTWLFQKYLRNQKIFEWSENIWMICLIRVRGQENKSMCGRFGQWRAHKLGLVTRYFECTLSLFGNMTKTVFPLSYPSQSHTCYKLIATRRIYRGADKIFSVSKCKNWFR